MTDRNSEGVSIELLPLPEADGFMETFDTYGCPVGSEDAWGEETVKETIRANVAHATAAKDAEIEALRVRADAMAGEAIKHEARAERLAEALRMIAAPIRPDGTWNRDRETCRQIAEEALRDHDQEVG